VKTKPIKVDWEELESAFDSGGEEMSYYLDRITGHLALEGEGEEGDFEDQEIRPSPAVHDRTRILIEPLKTATKIEWIERFLEEVPDLDPEFSSSLKEALSTENKAAALTDVLHRHAEGSDRWYLYRAARLREMMEKWLEFNEVAVVNPPPWKDSGGDQSS
jgi:hypothetical protein